MKTEHTQGEWTYSELCNFSGTLVSFISSENREIAQLRGCITGDEAEALANAKLIATAPDLLEACNEFLNIINRTPAALHHYGNAIKLAEQAIKKATE